MLSAGVIAQVVDSSGTSCGGVTLPFPPARYNRLGLNLTCDRTSNPPRLFLGGSGGHSIRVVDISLRNATGAIVNTTFSSVAAAATRSVSLTSPCGTPPAPSSTPPPKNGVSPCTVSSPAAMRQWCPTR
ncbi:hypothetical protein ACQ4PT_021254 [Festuca glaucescens]